VVDVDRVADRLGDLRVQRPRVAARRVEHCEAGAGCDPLDLDVAPRRQRMSGVDEGGEVIGLPSLRSDDARCAERLPPVGWGAGAEPAEVPVVEDDTSMPSEMIPTLTPVPSAICCAASTFITSLASGSTSGTIGLLGQTCCAAESASMRPWRWTEPDAAALPLTASPTSATSTNRPGNASRRPLCLPGRPLTGWSRPNAKTAWESPRTLRLVNRGSVLGAGCLATATSDRGARPHRTVAG
jgi:hypothetical protein